MKDYRKPAEWVGAGVVLGLLGIAAFGLGYFIAWLAMWIAAFLPVLPLP